jgi:hypothetical protein
VWTAGTSDSCGADARPHLLRATSSRPGPKSQIKSHNQEKPYGFG